ncbi:MAG: efflux RND transporter periplasmic adaptor subunit, partial [Fulvivirga sp.]|nr:efflux RND transporter periplasmic adaptor subunit [Fulvivirga sp.]
TEMHDHSGKATTWTCSMHPQIRQSEPGQCPICGMDLIPVETSNEEGIDPNAITMSPTAMLIAGVRTTTVNKNTPIKKINLTGKVQEDERLLKSQSTHIPGRVESLLINFTGEYVSQNQILAMIYSPELVTAQEELFVAQKYKDTQPALFEAAKAKLKNWKLSTQQIDQILANGRPMENFPIRADVSGYVVDKKVNTGDYIKRGQTIFTIADLSRVWVLFDVYESELPWVNKGDQITFTVSSLPGQQFESRISYIDPVIDPNTRVAKARTEVKNTNLQLKPEMFVSGTISASLADKNEALVIPKSAVMWTGERSVVYIKQTTDQGISFVMREVILGPALGEGYIIKSGLEGGEEIATSGTFSIDAAAQLAGKPSMMAPEGGVKLTPHHHGEIKASDLPVIEEKDLATFDVSDKFQKQIKEVYQYYLPIKDALVRSDAKSAQEAAEKLLTSINNVEMNLVQGNAHNYWMDLLKPLKNAAQNIKSSTNLNSQRDALIPLTNNLVKAIKAFKVTGLKGYYQFCPMANNNEGAYWLSAEDDVRNPYFGDAMLTCGEVVETIGN